MGHELLWVGGVHITQGQPHGSPHQPQDRTPEKTLNTRAWGMTLRGGMFMRAEDPGSIFGKNHMLPRAWPGVSTK